MSDRELELATKNLKDWILQLPYVTESPHRFGGTEFQVSGLEFMHSHGDTFLDIRLSKRDQESVLKQGSALPHRFAPQAGWVSYRISTPDDAEKARSIIQMAYANAKTLMDNRKLFRQKQL